MNRADNYFAIALLVLLTIVALRDMVPSGHYRVSPDLSRLVPHERFVFDNGVTSFTGDPAYLDVQLPRRFDSVSATIDFSSTGPYPCAFGVVTGTSDEPGYTLRDYAHPAAEPLRVYEVREPATIYTNAPLFKLTAYGAAGLQTVYVNGAAVAVSDPQKPLWLKSDRSISELVIPAGHLQIAGPGMFSTDRAAAAASDSAASEAVNPVELSLTDAAYRGTTVRFVFSQPYVEVDPSCAVTGLTLDFKRPSLRDSGIVRFMRDYLRDSYYAFKNR